MRPVLKIAVTVIAMATCIVPVGSHAQGLLGTLLQKSRAARPGAQNDPRPVENPQDGVARNDYVIGLRLHGDQWEVGQNYSSDTIHPSAIACRGLLASDAHRMLANYAVRPLAGKDLRPNALIVKDGADASSPAWQIGLVSCGQGKPVTGQPLDQMTMDYLAASNVDIPALLSEAAEYIRQTDGSFPPPPTAAAISQAATDKKYLYEVILYQANGQMIGGKQGQLFDTREECDRYVTARLRQSVENARGSTVAGTSVFVSGDDTGYMWLGCIHPSDLGTSSFASFFDTKMTRERATSMPRFPVLSPSSGEAPSSKRGSQTKF